MDIESLYYFIETARDLHITRTAQRLHMSQQTLSNHVARLESYYGTKLFYRYPTLQLTPTGKEVLNFARELHQNESNLRAVLTDTLNSEAGEITLGASSPRSNYYLPNVLKKFSEKFPNVTIDLIDVNSPDAEILVQKNQVDFAVAIDSEISKLKVNVKATYEDPVYFCVSDRLLYRCYGEKMYTLRERAINGAYLENFSEIPFMILSPQGRMGKRIARCFNEAGYEPKTYLKADHTTLTNPLCNAALAGCFTSHMNLTRWKEHLDDDVNVFPLHQNGRPVLLNLYVIYSRQRYLNHHCRYFLELLERQFSIMGGEEVSHLSRSIINK
ncbi:MAG: LysR family transcriptional regulator [Synergistaceae bacterium]|nr:LysR family transcriptional regulator [Synergistaceae bacterium]